MKKAPSKNKHKTVYCVLTSHYTKISILIVKMLSAVLLLSMILLVVHCNTLDKVILKFMKTKMDFIGTATWTQMTIVGSFIIYFLNSLREYRYGITLRTITSWTLGSFAVSTIIFIDVLYVILMTIAYYIQNYFVFYLSAIIAVLIQFSLMGMCLVLNSSSVQLWTILNRERQVLDNLTEYQEGRHYILADILSGNETIEEKMFIAQKLITENVIRIDKHSEVYPLHSYRFEYLVGEFETLFWSISGKKKKRDIYYSYYPSLVSSLLAIHTEDRDKNKLWMSALILSLLKTEKKACWIPIQNIFYELLVTNSIELKNAMTLLIECILFLWATEKDLNQKIVVDGFQKLLENLAVINAEQVEKRNPIKEAWRILLDEPSSFEDCMIMWVAADDTVNLQKSVRYNILVSPFGGSFVGEILPDRINSLINEYSDDRRWL